MASPSPRLKYSMLESESLMTPSCTPPAGVRLVHPGRRVTATMHVKTATTRGPLQYTESSPSKRLGVRNLIGWPSLGLICRGSLDRHRVRLGGRICQGHPV